VEWLTSEMERRIVAEMHRVDDEWGGIVRAVSEGAVQAEVTRRAYEYERGIQEGRIPKVGVNRYRVEEEAPQVELHPYRPEQAEESIGRTAQVIAARDPQAVAAALEALRQAAVNGSNTMPPLMQAVRAYATLGEISRVLKEVFGAFQEPVRF